MQVRTAVLGDDRRQVADRSDERDGLAQAAVVLDGLRQIGWLVGRAEPAPQDEVRAGRD
jgi:hypothetical protein